MKFHPLFLDALFIALAMTCFLQGPTSRSALALGGALGACMLTRPTIVPVVPPLLAWMVWRRPDGRTLRLWILTFVVAAGILAPWVIRNYVVLGAFVLTRNNTPYVCSGSATIRGRQEALSTLPIRRVCARSST